MSMKFTKDHEWVSAENGIAAIGISDYAQKALGDIVYVELPAVGTALRAGKSFGSVESVKAVSELYAPVSGVVTEVNGSLEDIPELLNQDAFATWIIRAELADPGELDSLLEEEPA